MFMTSKDTIKIQLLITVVIVMIVTTQFASFIADKLCFLFMIKILDKNIMWSIIHHLTQPLIPILILIVCLKYSVKDLGFHWGNKKIGSSFVYKFSIVWFLIYFVLFLINYFGSNIPDANYDLDNHRYLLGELTFRLLLVGPSEEILFRVFPIVLLLRAGWSSETDIFGFKITYAGFISAILFSFAHFGINFFPFEIYHFNIVQFVTCLGLGLFYAIVYHNTKSIIYPIIIHSISDVIPLLSLLLLKIVI